MGQKCWVIFLDCFLYQQDSDLEAVGITGPEQLLPELKETGMEEDTYGHIRSYNTYHADSKIKSAGRNTLNLIQEFKTYTQKKSCQKSTE